MSAASEFIAEWNGLTIPNPFVSKERVYQPEMCAVEATTLNDETVWIHGIRAFNPGKGCGSRTMKLLCTMADYFGVKLMLQPQPFGTKPLGKRALATWYRKEDRTPQHNGNSTTETGAAAPA